MTLPLTCGAILTGYDIAINLNLPQRLMQCVSHERHMKIYPTSSRLLRKSNIHYFAAQN